MNHFISKQTFQPLFLLNFTFLPLVSHQTRRFVFSLILAVLIHLFIIFQINFKLADKIRYKQKSLDIIINPVITNQKVKNPDYFAQSNQQGGGKKEYKIKPANVLPASPELPRKQSSKKTLYDVTVKQLKQVNKQFPVKKTRTQLSTQVKSKQKAARLVKKHRKRKYSQPAKSLNKTVITSNYIANLKKQIIDLEADIDIKTRVYTRRGRHKYVNASTAKALDAEYIRQWTRKIERIGNLNYPAQAQKKKLSGKLILAVTIDPYGKILNIEIRRSSKYKILDDAAIRIVKISAPFAPIPKSVLQDNNALVITRTWLFYQKSDGKFIIN